MESFELNNLTISLVIEDDKLIITATDYMTLTDYVCKVSDKQLTGKIITDIETLRKIIINHHDDSEIFNIIKEPTYNRLSLTVELDFTYITDELELKLVPEKELTNFESMKRDLRFFNKTLQDYEQRIANLEDELHYWRSLAIMPEVDLDEVVGLYITKPLRVFTQDSINNYRVKYNHEVPNTYMGPFELIKDCNIKILQVPSKVIDEEVFHFPVEEIWIDAALDDWEQLINFERLERIVVIAGIKLKELADVCRNITSLKEILVRGDFSISGNYHFDIVKL